MSHRSEAVISTHMLTESDLKKKILALEIQLVNQMQELVCKETAIESVTCSFVSMKSEVYAHTYNVYTYIMLGIYIYIYI